MKKLRLLIVPGLLLLLTFALIGSVHAENSRSRKKADLAALEEQRGRESDALNLAAVMLKDGHTDRAGAVLRELSATSTTLDHSRYFLLLGLISLSTGDMIAAERDLALSVKHGPSDPMARVFLAQAAFKNGHFAETVRTLDEADGAGDDLPGTHLLKANACWKSGNPKRALEIFAAAAERFTDNADVWRSHSIALIELGLFQEAVSVGREYLRRPGVTAKDYTALSEALIRVGGIDEAILILEQARLQFHSDRDLTLQLARAYMKGGYELIAARLFHAAALEDPSFTLDAAELYRRHGQLARALRLNEKVDDQKAKFRQRLGLFIELERYEDAAALSSRLSRLGLLEEDTIAYALAYALFKIGQFDTAEKQLAGIDDPALYSKALELRLAMDKCRVNGWQCQ